jgi:outer membrane protein assembly factor BamE (lipoprotein component of BamABCDE complex)
MQIIQHMKRRLTAEQFMPISTYAKSVVLCMLISNCSFASTYCPIQGGYIKVGMTIPQVMAACGKPIDVQKSRTFATRNVAIQQLIYRIGESTGGRGNVVFPTDTNSGNLMFTISANKVESISLNGVDTKGTTMCPDTALQVGSSAQDVIDACGQPSIVNNSYKQISEGSQQIQQEIWTVSTGDYSPKLTLTFQNGILEKIQ